MVVANYTCAQGFFNLDPKLTQCIPCPESTWNYFYTSENRLSCSECGKGRYMKKGQCFSFVPREYDVLDTWQLFVLKLHLVKKFLAMISF